MMQSTDLKEKQVLLEKRAKTRIARRLMPFLICLFIIAFINDRVNLGFAKLEMTRELGFDAEMIGFGAGIFFIGYFLFEIPGSVLVETWSARKWLARITAELKREKQLKKSKRTFSIWEAFRHRNVLLLAAGYFCAAALLKVPIKRVNMIVKIILFITFKLTSNKLRQKLVLFQNPATNFERFSRHSGFSTRIISSV